MVRHKMADSPRRSLWRRLAHLWHHRLRWPVVGALWLTALALGMIGFSRLSAATGQARSPSDLFYLALQLFTLESGSALGPKGWELEVARYLAPAVAAYTALQALLALFSEQLQSIRLAFARSHVVICGLGRRGYLLAQAFHARGDRVVIIERNEGDDQIDLCRDLGIPVLLGDARDEDVLRQARVHRATAVVALLRDDGDNAELAVRAGQVARGRSGRGLTCAVHITDPRLWSLLRKRELELSQAGGFRLEFFSVYEQGARALLKRFPAFGQGDAIRPHPLVVGLGSMGERLVLHLARQWQSRHNASGERLCVTVIDRNAKPKVESLCLRYPQLGQVCDLVARQMEIRSPEFDRAEFLRGGDGRHDVSIVYVCVDDDAFGLYAALALRQHVRQQAIPVVVRMATTSGLARLLDSGECAATGLAGPYAFGLLEETCSPELVLGGTHEIMARAIHEEYLREQAAAGQTPDTNPSMLPWERLPEALRESNRRQADSIAAELQAAGFQIEPVADWEAPPFAFSAEELEPLARREHERFVAERVSAGWSYAPGPKNVRARTSPTLLLWDALSEPEKEKDRCAVRAWPALLARAGFQIERFERGS